MQLIPLALIARLTIQIWTSIKQPFTWKNAYSMHESEELCQNPTLDTISASVGHHLSMSHLVHLS